MGSAAYDGAPVAVIGNGPVGQTTALLLARWGIPTVLLDARPERDLIGSKAICQQRDVLDLWESVGAGRQIAAEGLTWTTSRTFYRDHELFSVEFKDPGRSPFPPFVNLSQARTEQILDARIADQPLIQARWAHHVTGVAQDGAGVTLHCSTEAGPTDIRAPYVVACAGARSEGLRATLGLTFPGDTFVDYFLICDIRAEIPEWAQERRFYFDPEWNPGRQVLIHPCPGSTFRIDWQVPGDFDLAAEESGGALDHRIRQIIGDREYEIVWKSVYRFHSRHTDRLRVGRVLLAGDCAHLVAPFGARGLNSGAQDAENAAWKIAFALNGWGDEDLLLESYHEERLAAARENLAVTSETMDFLVPRDGAAWRRRHDVLERAVADPRAREQVNSGRLAEPYWYVDSPLVTASSRHPFRGRPPRGEAPPVAPGVLIPDVPVVVPDQPGATRTRDIARDGLLFLTGADVSHADLAGTVRAATAAPFRILGIADIDAAGLLEPTFAAHPGDVWIVRPDGHVAAVVGAGDLAAVTAAVRRSIGVHPPRP